MSMFRRYRRVLGIVALIFGVTAISAAVQDNAMAMQMATAIDGGSTGCDGCGGDDGNPNTQCAPTCLAGHVAILSLTTAAYATPSAPLRETADRAPPAHARAIDPSPPKGFPAS